MIQNQLLGLLKRPILKNLAISGSGSGIAQACMLVNALLLARVLSPEGFGIYTASYAISSLTAFFFTWGLDTWLLREASTSDDSGDLLGKVLIIKGMFGVVWSGVLLTVMPSVQPETYLRPVLAVSVLDTLCDSFFISQVFLLNAQRRFTISSSFLILSRGGRLVLTIVFVLFGLRNPLDFALSRWIATLISLIAISFMLKPRLPRKINRDIFKIYRSSIPYGISEFLSVIYLQVDVTLLALISGDRKAVGTYSPASSMINALFILPNAAFNVFLPTIILLIEQQSPRVLSFLRKMFLSFAALGLVLWFSVGILGKPAILLILGQDYKPTGELLVWLSPLLFLKSIEFGCVVLLVAAGWQKQRLGPQIASASANIILNLLLIPLFGVWAVATNYLASEVILFAGYVWIAIRCLKMNTQYVKVK